MIQRNTGWSAKVVTIDFSLLDTQELNKRDHLGLDQYFDDPRPRAGQFIARPKRPSTSVLG